MINNFLILFSRSSLTDKESLEADLQDSRVQDLITGDDAYLMIV